MYSSVGAGFKPARSRRGTRSPGLAGSSERGKDLETDCDSRRHHRRSIRLPKFDYARQGAYFVTVCTCNRICLFGDLVEGEMRLNEAGCLVQEVFDGLPAHYPHVELDARIIMPNHVHGIVWLVGTGFEPGSMKTAGSTRHGLSEIVRAFKTFSARRINTTHGTKGRSVWQRNYYEHIIRDEDDLNRVREYIVENPARWDEDPENPVCIPR